MHLSNRCGPKAVSTLLMHTGSLGILCVCFLVCVFMLVWGLRSSVLFFLSEGCHSVTVTANDKRAAKTVRSQCERFAAGTIWSMNMRQHWAPKLASRTQLRQAKDTWHVTCRHLWRSLAVQCSMTAHVPKCQLCNSVTWLWLRPHCNMRVFTLASFCWS